MSEREADKKLVANVRHGTERHPQIQDASFAENDPNQNDREKRRLSFQDTRRIRSGLFAMTGGAPSWVNWRCRMAPRMPDRPCTPILSITRRKNALAVFGLIFISAAISFVDRPLHSKSTLSLSRQGNWNYSPRKENDGETL